MNDNGSMGWMAETLLTFLCLLSLYVYWLYRCRLAVMPCEVNQDDGVACCPPSSHCQWTHRGRISGLCGKRGITHLLEQNVQVGQFGPADRPVRGTWALRQLVQPRVLVHLTQSPRGASGVWDSTRRTILSVVPELFLHVAVQLRRNAPPVGRRLVITTCLDSWLKRYLITNVRSRISRHTPRLPA